VRRLFVRGYYCGFSNQKMALDIAVALAYLTGRVLVPYRFRVPRRVPANLKPGRWPQALTVPDLFEIPLPWSDEHLLKTWISVDGKLDCGWQPVFESVLCFPPAMPDDARAQHFRNGRPYVYTLNSRENEAPDLHINTHTLGHYSHFFYLDEPRRRQIVDLIKRLRPKEPYLKAADRIAASFGPFNAIHVRRGDFVSNDLSRDGISRAASISGQEVVANLASRMRRDEPLVICTDGSSREEFFGPIQKYFREVIFLDRYLRESAGIQEMISQLPRDDEAVLAMLTQLIASKAQIFAGTLFSTFTALIHRLRGFDRQKCEFLYCYNDFLSPLVHFERCEFLPVADGPYSWNRIRYPVSPSAYSWLREWPESFDTAKPPSGEELLRFGTIDLLAGAAAVHGNTIRCMKDEGGRDVIGCWTDPADSVTWDLLLPSSGNYLLEIQYACPENSAGSHFRVGIEADELKGRTWNTGSLASLSPWLPLGRLRIPAGRSTLAVRVIQKGSNAVMNLKAVRLVPAESAT
jgi:GDP-fucose protein O-fucosyltransferase